jgi:hypothetical protein
VDVGAGGDKGWDGTNEREGILSQYPSLKFFGFLSLKFFPGKYLSNKVQNKIPRNVRKYGLIHSKITSQNPAQSILPNPPIRPLYSPPLQEIPKQSQK